MKGYFCIYECSKNQWLFDGIYWQNDRDFYKQSIGTKHAIQINQSYNYNPNLPQVEVIDTQSVELLTEGNTIVSPLSIMKFETMQEAEEYLLEKFTSANEQFYSIRKIYF